MGIFKIVVTSSPKDSDPGSQPSLNKTVFKSSVSWGKKPRKDVTDTENDRGRFMRPSGWNRGESQCCDFDASLKRCRSSERLLVFGMEKNDDFRADDRTREPNRRLKGAWLNLPAAMKFAGVGI